MISTNNHIQTLTTKLRIAHWNARTARDKKEEIVEMLTVLDVLVIIETWLSNSDNFLFSGFNTYRLDRAEGRTGGGIATLERKTFSYSACTNLINPCPEVELCGVVIAGLSRPITVIGCYIPPDIFLNAQEWDLLISNVTLNVNCNLSKMTVFRRF